MSRIDDIDRALEERGPLRRTSAEVWREDVPAQDSAPSWSPETADATNWGRSKDEARSMLQRQMCPICGEGPWKSPLNHVAKRHGIDRHTMRDACGLTSTAVVADPELIERFREINLGKDMTAPTEAGRRHRRKYRMTEAGKARLTQNLAHIDNATRLANLELARAAQASKRNAQATTEPDRGVL